MNGANWIDILLAAIMLLSVGLATLRGLLHSVFGLAAAALAFIVALRRGDFFAPWLESALGTSASVSLSYAAVFVLALLVFGAVGKMIRATARKLDLGGLDRVGGFVFGLLARGTRRRCRRSRHRRVAVGGHPRVAGIQTDSGRGGRRVYVDAARGIFGNGTVAL